MGSKWVLVLVIFMFVSLQGCLSQTSGCWEEERVALLQLKHFFNDPNSLQDWVEGDQHNNLDCCQWGSVECNNSTGKVISLDLESARDGELREGYLNASLFSAFEQLEELDLWGNSIAGFVDNGGLDKLSRLRNLESLDLSFNMFNNDIFSSLIALPSLKSLDLSYNRLNETVDLQGLDSCKNLKELDLSNNQIEKVVFPKGALSSLKELHLNDNRLKGIVDVPDSLNNLEAMDMSYNEIDKFVFRKGLKKLEDLYLVNVSIHDGISSLLHSLASLPSLRFLDLSFNNFSESTTTQDGSSHHSIAAFTNLEFLYLQNCQIYGTSSFQDLLNFTSLTDLNMDDSTLDISFFQIGMMPSLMSLSLNNCELQGSLSNQDLPNFKNLKSLDMDHTGLDLGFLQMIGLMTSLETLSLVNCGLQSTLFLEGLDKLSRLRNLEYLDLGGNMFNNDILSSLNALPSLTSLNLSDNRLNETVDLQVLHSCQNLTNLDLSNNKIEKVVILKGLKKLEDLSLRNVSIHDGISSVLHSLASLPSLRVLDLSLNNFSESTTTKDGSSHHSIAAFTNLEYLDLRNCQIYGTSSFQDLLNFTSLTDLSMDDSTLDISFFQIGMMSSLEFLSLANCELQGSLSNQDLQNLNNLKALYMDYTSLDLGFLQMIGPMTSLVDLSLSNCGLQGTLLLEDGGVIPKLLYHQQYLEYLDLSNNNLIGGFPNFLLENNTGLFYLRLANNLLGGYLSIPSHTSLNSLDISNNSFRGHIPKVADLPYLVNLNLSRNHFDGSIPSSIGDLNSLQSLDLSYNNLSGEIPEHLAEGCTSLTGLVLSNNKLRGKIFSTKFNLTNLKILQLNGNSFTGSIPDSLSKATDLEGLYLGDNKLSGTIPSWLGNLSSLIEIIMPNNHFGGPIPLEFCRFQYLEVLNLAENNLSGSLPSCSSLLSITHVHLSKNKLQGQLKDAFFNSSSLVTLDLGYNHFDGSIPTWIGWLSQLTYLILSNNNLEGDMPTQLCQLNLLRLVDLSHNNLSGYIPFCLDFTALHSSDHEVASPFFSEIPRFDGNPGEEYEMHRIEESVEFTTKTFSYSYHGKVLTYMSGVDLSCNKLTGPIPPQVGNLNRIHTLNLSHNNLSGPIPVTFSKLEQIESLDLSYNNLNGKIPPQLVELYTLSSFNVAHNNLSGKTPERVAQFNTFDENSYEGNPLLCGPPLHKSCETTRQPSPMPGASTDKEKDNDLIDMDIFYMSFTGSYIIVLLGIAAVLYINPYWRRAWFYLAERWMTSCYYFIVDNLPHRFCH